MTRAIGRSTIRLAPPVGRGGVLTTAPDDIQHADPAEPRASVVSGPLARADVFWTLFGLTSLIAVLWMAVTRG